MTANAPSPHIAVLLHAEVTRGAFDNLQRYLQHGRRFADLDGSALASLWVGAMREWSEVIELRSRELEDADAEYALRREQPPVEMVGPELTKIIAGSRKVIDGLPLDAIEVAQAEMQATFRAERDRSN